MKTKKESLPMFATIAGPGLRCSWFNNLTDAMEYAKRMLGVWAIEEIGKGYIWQNEERKPEVTK